MSDLLRHIDAVTGLALPGGFLPVTLGGQPVGYVTPRIATLLTGAAIPVHLAGAAALAAAEATLIRAGTVRPRGEAFDVRATPYGPVLGHADRATLPVLGLEAQGIHMNGFVRAPTSLQIWVAKRAASKLLDPSKLDHLVAGGISAGMDARTTLIKEAWEEAGIPAELAATALPAGTISYALLRPEGLRRDRLHCFDLELPPSFTPTALDGEVESFTLTPAEDVLAQLRSTDAFKFNVTLVLLSFLLRHAVLTGPEADALGARLPWQPGGMGDAGVAAAAARPGAPPLDPAGDKSPDPV